MDFLNLTKKLGNKTRELRVSLGLTQEDMDEGGDDERIPYRTIQNIEAGKSNPSLKTLYKLAKRLNVTVTSLLDD